MPHQAPDVALGGPAPAATAVPAVRLRGLRKNFGPVTAVDGIDLDIRPGEFFAMLGPSGSGKTTVLRMIAGFEQPTDGVIELGGQDVSRLAPFDRDVNTVFQDYALFPHMNVTKNVEYGLRVKGVPKEERRRRAAEALHSVRFDDYGRRRPSQLSGGQRQRVALARALVNRPKVLLLDEPLSNLDLKLREEMRAEISSLQRRLGIATVFVTHDQDEALTMSDRIAVMRAGRIEQLGTAKAIYERPETSFVATFIGTANMIAAELASPGRVTTPAGPAKIAQRPDASGRMLLTVRPERLRLTRSGEGWPARIVRVTYLGARIEIQVRLADGTLFTVNEVNEGASAWQEDDAAALSFNPEAAWLIAA